MNIYKEYSQQQLNDQYNNRLHVPDFAVYFERWNQLSAAARNTCFFAENLAYGTHSRETLDIYPAKEQAATTVVFIHGGYWQLFDKRKFHFVANSLLPYNLTTVLLNYPLAPDATIDDMGASCKKALQWLQNNLPSYNGDPANIYLAGHSAGAQLAALMLEASMAQKLKFPLKGLLAFSGLYNLHPIRLCFVNNLLKMDEKMVIRNSPIFLTPDKSGKIVIAFGSAETAEFKAQSAELYKCWKEKQANIKLQELPNLNHFSIMDTLSASGSLLHQMLLELVS